MAGRRWTNEEDDVIRSNIRMTAAELGRRLGRTASSVHGRRNVLGVNGYVWTKSEDQFIRDHPDMTAEEIGKRLDRTKMAVKHRRKALGVEFTGGTHWTQKQEDVIRRNPQMSGKDLSRLTGKSLYAVHHKRKSLGLSRKTVHIPWTDEDDRYLRENTGRLASKMIASRMGRTVTSVYIRQGKLGLLKTLEEKVWTDAEIEFLKEHRNKPNAWIAKRLGRTNGAVTAARNRTGILRYGQHMPWTPEEDEILRASMDRLKRAELYRILPYRSPFSISARLDKLGMRRKNRKGFTYRFGYKSVYEKGRPLLEHRVIMEKHIGRKLKRREEVHHVDGDKKNNDIKNLDLLANHSAHQRAEASFNKLVRNLMDSGIVTYNRNSKSYHVRNSQA